MPSVVRLNRNQLIDWIESKEAGKVPEMSRVKMDRGPGSSLVIAWSLVR